MADGTLTLSRALTGALSPLAGQIVNRQEQLDLERQMAFRAMLEQALMREQFGMETERRQAEQAAENAFRMELEKRLSRQAFRQERKKGAAERRARRREGHLERVTDLREQGVDASGLTRQGVKRELARLGAENRAAEQAKAAADLRAVEARTRASDRSNLPTEEDPELALLQKLLLEARIGATERSNQPKPETELDLLLRELRGIGRSGQTAVGGREETEARRIEIETRIEQLIRERIAELRGTGNLAGTNPGEGLNYE